MFLMTCVIHDVIENYVVYNIFIAAFGLKGRSLFFIWMGMTQWRNFVKVTSNEIIEVRGQKIICSVFQENMKVRILLEHTVIFLKIFHLHSALLKWEF